MAQGRDTLAAIVTRLKASTALALLVGKNIVAVDDLQNIAPELPGRALALELVSGLPVETLDGSTKAQYYTCRLMATCARRAGRSAASGDGMDWLRQVMGEVQTQLHRWVQATAPNVRLFRGVPEPVYDENNERVSLVVEYEVFSLEA